MSQRIQSGAGSTAALSSLSEHAVQVAGLSIRFGGEAVLDQVTFALQAGEAVALVGPSGAGKTTLLRSLQLATTPSAGSVVLHGQNLATLSEEELATARARIGFVPQDLALIDLLRVSQSVLAGGLAGVGLLGALRRFFRPSSAELERVHSLLERVGIGELLFRRVSTLSGGERQRVAVARALFANPSILIADEPVAAVDPERARSVLQLLIEVAREQKAALIVSLHDVQLARALFPRVIGLRAGRIVLDRATHELNDDDFEGLFALDSGRQPDLTNPQ